jgi:uncharacterized membrane protein YjfL (UPF0719 family)
VDPEAGVVNPLAKGMKVRTTIPGLAKWGVVEGVIEEVTATVLVKSLHSGHTLKLSVTEGDIVEVLP